MIGANRNTIALKPDRSLPSSCIFRHVSNMTASRTRSVTLSTEESRDGDNVIAEQYDKKSDAYRALISLVGRDKVQAMADHYEVQPHEAIEMAIDGHILPDEAGTDPLAEYDPDMEDVTVSTDLLRSINPHQDKHRVNPDHIDSLPQSTDDKIATMVAVVRYTRADRLVDSTEVLKLCREILGYADETLERHYVPSIMEFLIPHPKNENVRFTSRAARDEALHGLLMEIPGKAEEVVKKVGQVKKSKESRSTVRAEWQDVKAEYELLMGEGLPVLSDDDEAEVVEALNEASRVVAEMEGDSVNADLYEIGVGASPETP